MRAFMDKDFLLENETARTLFHKYAENQPIYDYHNHLPPREIAVDGGEVERQSRRQSLQDRRQAGTVGLARRQEA